ncbi:MAG: DnaJ domain-containing protein [Crocinitomicaceae bacterium]|nr:DnaJ domain-containing protein [Crocinitomicaceae bacterium]
MLSYYEILQVDENASTEEIKKAYRKLSKVLHPDLHDNSKESNVMFNLLHDAYETLSDPVKRSNYDLSRQPEKTSTSSNQSDYTNYHSYTSEKTQSAYANEEHSKNTNEPEDRKRNIIIYTVFAIVFTGLVLFFNWIPDILMIFLILLAIPIYFIIKLFRK